jgi:hypothetical protein
MDSMSKKMIKVMCSFLVITVLVLGFSAFSRTETVSAANIEPSGGSGGRGGNGQRSGASVFGTNATLTPLSDTEKDALNQAILEEYGAFNLYQSVLNQYGNVYPFSMIVTAEQQHINALVRQATKYGVTVPTNPGLAVETSFNSLSAACQAGVKAEIADAALYDSLKLVVTHTDILQVFDTLQSASLNMHLVAFQTCD